VAAKDDIRQMGFECYLKTEPLTAHNHKIVEYTTKNKLQATVSDALSTAFGRRMSAIKIEVKRAIASAMAFLDEPKAHPGIEQIYLGECTGYNKFESDPDKRVKLDPSSQDITLIHQYCLEIFIGHLRGRGQLYGLGDEWMKSIASSVCSYWSSEDGLPPWLVITRRRKLSPKDSEDDASKKQKIESGSLEATEKVVAKPPAAQKKPKNKPKRGPPQKTKKKVKNGTPKKGKKKMTIG